MSMYLCHTHTHTHTDHVWTQQINNTLLYWINQYAKASITLYHTHTQIGEYKRAIMYWKYEKAQGIANYIKTCVNYHCHWSWLAEKDVKKTTQEIYEVLLCTPLQLYSHLHNDLLKIDFFRTSVWFVALSNNNCVKTMHKINSLKKLDRVKAQVISHTLSLTHTHTQQSS